MKNVLTLLLLFFSTTCLWAQDDIVGKWRIDEIPGLREHANFRLENFKASVGVPYGNSLEFLPDGKFGAGYSAPCGNDCFPYVFGRYEKIGESYVRLHADSIYIRGLGCKNEKRYPDQDIGAFFMHKSGNGIKLLLSTGDHEADLINVTYSDIMDKFNETEHDIDRLVFEEVKTDDYKDIVAEVLSSKPNFDLSKINILYVEKMPCTSYTAILFEYNGKKQIMMWRTFNRKALYTGNFAID